MAAMPKPEPAFDSHRQAMIELARKMNELAGIPAEPGGTVEELRESMLQQGIRPEDNILSSELMRMRYGDDWQDE